MPSLKLKKPAAIVMDVTGTIATRAFMAYSPESREFMRQHIREYVQESWGKRELRLALNFVRVEQDQELNSKQFLNVNTSSATNLSQNEINESVKLKRTSNIDLLSNKAPVKSNVNINQSNVPLVADPKVSMDVQIESLISNILWRLDNVKYSKSPALGLFHLNISEWGYKKGILKTPVYEETAYCLDKWKNQDNIKMYITLGSSSFLKAVFSQTTNGDLLPFIDGHMNLMDFQCKNFSKLSEMLGEPSSKILFITRIPFDARLASSNNIRTVIIVRNDFDPDAVTILKGIERKRKRKEQKKQANLTIQSPASSTSNQNLRLNTALDEMDVNEKNALGTNFASVMDDTENELSVASKITAKDIKDFPVIQRLDEIIWD